MAVDWWCHHGADGCLRHAEHAQLGDLELPHRSGSDDAKPCVSEFFAFDRLWCAAQHWSHAAGAVEQQPADSDQHTGCLQRNSNRLECTVGVADLVDRGTLGIVHCRRYALSSGQYQSQQLNVARHGITQR